jgi:DNA-binding NtrC family response regulator
MQGSKRILVVDDERVARTLTARALMEAGYEVVVAEDGMAGYALAKVESFDLVVTDSRMPRLTGSDLVAWLRMLNPSLPIIHLSGSLGRNPAPDDMPADVPTLYKPFDVRELVKLAERMLATG